MKVEEEESFILIKKKTLPQDVVFMYINLPPSKNMPYGVMLLEADDLETSASAHPF